MDLLGALGGVVQRAPAKDAEAPERASAEDGGSNKDRFDKAMKSAETGERKEPEEAARPSRKKERAKNEDQDADGARLLNTDDTAQAVADAAVAASQEAIPSEPTPDASVETDIDLTVAAPELTVTSKVEKTPVEAAVATVDPADTIAVADELAEAETVEIAAATNAASEAELAVNDALTLDENAPEAPAEAETSEPVEVTTEPREEIKKKSAASIDRATAVIIPKAEQAERPAGPQASIAETRPLEAQPASLRPERREQEISASAPQVAPTTDAPSAPPQASGDKLAAPAPLGSLQAQPALTQPHHATPQIHAHAETQTLVTTNAPVEAAQQVIAAIRTNAGGDKIEVRLDPPELGRVRIHFSMERNDAVIATVSTDRSDTLDLMRRNAGDLMKELERAGFTNVQLDFSTRGEASYTDAGAAGYSAQDGLFGEDELTDNTTFIYKRPQIEGRLDRLV
ncbi:MAG: flagellar hook-length control protein FliK [Parvularculaceae bacterium]